MPRIVTEKADTLPVLAEIFREHGFEGASLSLISKATGLGKGSLYHFFPGGKEQMATDVLAEIDGWFETHIFAPLADSADPAATIATTLDDVAAYFHSGRRVCLVGALALGDTRDRFALAVKNYFARWVDALAMALERCGQPTARDMAEEAVAAIQGAIVLARALDDPGCFARAMTSLRRRLLAEVAG